MPTLTPDLIEEAARVQPDMTLATSFLDANVRGRVIALALFAHEVSRARAAVSEVGLAAIRLQWWREILDQIYTNTPVRAQPIARALAETIIEAGLPRLYFDAMIDAHERALEPMPFASWAEVETYLDDTHGNLNRMCLLACGATVLSAPMNEVAAKCGIAWGLAHLLVGLPGWCARRSCWLPETERKDLDMERLFSGQIDAPTHAILLGALQRVQAARRGANRVMGEARFGNVFPVLAPPASRCCMPSGTCHRLIVLGSGRQNPAFLVASCAWLLLWRWAGYDLI